ncbi:hypothetical protein V2J09_005087 [Rumex salicifolius]
MIIPTSILLLGLTFLVIPTEQSSTRQPNNYANHFCINTTGNYTQGSTYQHNLNTLLSDLQSNSSTSSFYVTTAGDSANRIFGRYYCRHDVSAEACSACVKTAAKRVVSECPTAKEAVVLFQHCTLVYVNSSARLDDRDVAEPYATLSISTVMDVDRFYPILVSTMNRLLNESAYGPGSEGFATGEAKVSELETLYSLTQCSPDMNGVVCERCLRNALYRIDLCCRDVADMEFYYSSCQLRYSVIAPFYVVRASPAQTAVSPAVANPPPGNGAVALGGRNFFQLSYMVAFITAMFSFLAILNLVLKELTTKSSMSGFSSTQNPEKAYGLFYCRGDITTELCTSCVKAASKQILSACPVQKNAVVWYQECTLRYFANNSASFLEEDGKWIGEFNHNNVSDPSQFFVRLTRAISPMINKTAFGRDLPGYETGEVNISKAQMLYCLVQCSPFSTGDHCNQCLDGALDKINNCCSNGSTQLMIFNPSCQLRYDVLPFYNLNSVEEPNAPRLSPASSPIAMSAHSHLAGTNP